MSLRRKPHTFTHIPVTESKTGGRVDVPVEGTPRNVKGQITPMTADAVFKTFAGDLDVSRPFLFLCDVDSYSRTIKPGDRGVFNGERFYVNAEPMPWEAGDSTNCLQILLEKERPTE
jgi:hypothetical protein